MFLSFWHREVGDARRFWFSGIFFHRRPCYSTSARFRHVYLPGVKLISSSVNLSPSVSVTGMQGVFSLCLLMLYCTTHSFKCDLGLEMMGV